MLNRILCSINVLTLSLRVTKMEFAGKLPVAPKLHVTFTTVILGIQQICVNLHDMSNFDNWKIFCEPNKVPYKVMTTNSWENTWSSVTIQYNFSFPIPSILQSCLFIMTSNFYLFINQVLIILYTGMFVLSFHLSLTHASFPAQ